MSRSNSAAIACVAAVLLSAAAVRVAAQADGNALPPPVTLVVLSDLSPSASEPRIGDILVQRTQQLAAARGYDVQEQPVVIARAGDEAAASTAAQPPAELDDVRIASMLSGVATDGVDVVLASFYRVQGSELLIQFTLYDPVGGTILGGVLSRARTGLTLFTTLERAVAELTEPLDRYLVTRAIRRPPQDTVESIVIAGAQEGVAVSFAGRDVGRIAGGRLVVPYTPFPVGSLVRVDMVKPGYHPRSLVAELSAVDNVIDAEPLFRQSRVATELRWTYGQALGFGYGVRVYAVPDWTFISLGHHRFFLPAGGGGYDLVHRDLSLSVAQFLLLPVEAPVRVAAELGVGLVFTEISGFDNDSFVDVYLSLLSPTIEVSLRQWRLFVRPELRYTLGVGNNLLGRTWMRTPAGVPPISIGVARAW